MNGMGRLLGAGSLLLGLCPWACGEGETSSDGADEDMGGAGGTPASGDGGQGGSSAERTVEQIEQELRAAIDEHETSVPFTLLLGNASGTFFEGSHGASTADTRYESASTSKWVAATVILDVVMSGALDLESTPAGNLSFWTEDPSDWRSEVTLRHLLSFTSGFQAPGVLDDETCINLPGADFAACVEDIYEAAGERTEVPGTEFVYGSHHLQIAGLLTTSMSGANDFAEVFANFQATTGLFPTGAFDLPSLENPRLAGGMHWTGREYMDFLHALLTGELLNAELRQELFADHTTADTVELVASPVWVGLGEVWHYDLGNWSECPLPSWQDACEPLDRYSSPGAYGAYPFMDLGQGYYGILARQGSLGSFVDGLEVYRDLAPLAEELAAAVAEP